MTVLAAAIMFAAGYLSALVAVRASKPRRRPMGAKDLRLGSLGKRKALPAARDPFIPTTHADAHRMLVASARSDERVLAELGAEVDAIIAEYEARLGRDAVAVDPRTGLPLPVRGGQ